MGEKKFEGVGQMKHRDECKKQQDNLEMNGNNDKLALDVLTKPQSSIVGGFIIKSDVEELCLDVPHALV